MSAVYLGIGRVLPEDLPALREDWAALDNFDGAVFLDPEDGLDPAFLAAEFRKLHPSIPLILPLVARDRNRTALLGAARTAAAVGAEGLLLLSGRIDPTSPGHTVYELDPSQMVGFLREQGVGLELWGSSRCATGAERARARALAELGVRRCLVPWSGDDEPVTCEGLAPVYSVTEGDWAAGRLPPEGADRILHVVPGRGAAAAMAKARS